MKTGEKKFRKKTYQAPNDRLGFSVALRYVGEQIQKGNFAAGLSKANEMLADTKMSRKERARVLALVADSEFKRGRFHEAIQIQLKVAAESLSDPRLWLRAYVGVVRSFLRVPNVENATIMGRHALEIAGAKMAEFDEQVRHAKKVLCQKGSVSVPFVPVRPSVVATKMGFLFLQEGEPEVAEEFFRQAIKKSKGGANRARQGLAKIALSRGEFGIAIGLASDAIRRGGYRAKTLDAWKTLISARRQLCGWKISERIIKGLEIAPPSLRARTILIIVRELRKNDMRQWREVAKNWSQKEGQHFPYIETEIRKMVLATAKAEIGKASNKRAMAENLLKMPNLSAKEWLNGAKEYVRASLWDGEMVNIEKLIFTAGTIFGGEFVPRARHSLSLSCMMAKRHDLARPLLRENIKQHSAGNRVWAKSVWACARMESLLGNHSVAAEMYLKFASEKSVSVKFRVQAQLLWCQALITAGQPALLLEARSLMEATLADLADPDVIMNFARHLLSSPLELQSWGLQLFEHGKEKALSQFHSATSSSLAVSILYRLTRREMLDFGHYEDVLAFWEGLPSIKRDWLWSQQNRFWEYLGFVFDAYTKSGKLLQAETFAREILCDVATPLEQLPALGVPLARCLKTWNRISEGLELYEQMVRVAPTHPLCAEAWYWLALNAYKQGKIDASHKFAIQIRNIQGAHSGMTEQRSYDARALLLLSNLNVAQVDKQEVEHSIEFLTLQTSQIAHDLEELPD